MKSIVVYFGASGVTAKVSGKFSEAIGVDLFETQPEKPYTKADLDWRDKNSRSSVEMSNPESRPGIKKDNMGCYDTIFIRFPIWWCVVPTIINIFLKNYDFSGKTIIPFATSGGSGMGNTDKLLQASCKGATLLDGRVFSGNVKMADLCDWVRSLNL